MKRSLAALLAGIAVLLAAVQPAPTQTADVISEVSDGFGRTNRLTQAEPLPPSEQLIASLRAADYRDRETATRQLMSLGVKALPELKAALAKTSDPESAQRLERIIGAIGVKRLLDPTLVTLSLDGASPKEVFLELSRVSGYRFAMPEGDAAKGRLSIDAKDKPLWEVLKSLNAQTGIEVIADRSGFAVHKDGESVTPFVHLAGPFRFTAEEIGQSSSTLLKRTKSGPIRVWDEGYTVKVRLDAEPKITLLGLSSLKLLRATDNLGNSLLNTTEARDVWEYTESRRRDDHSLMPAASFSLDLARRDRTATEIADLQGIAKIVLVKDVRIDIEVAKLQKAAKRTVKGELFTLTIESVTLSESDSVLEVGIALVPNRKDSTEMLEGGGISERVVIETEQGRRADITFIALRPEASSEVPQQGLLPPPGPGGDGAATSRWTLRLRGADGAKVSDFTRIKILDWIGTEREISFAFKNIPLP